MFRFRFLPVGGIAGEEKSDNQQVHGQLRWAINEEWREKSTRKLVKWVPSCMSEPRPSGSGSVNSALTVAALKYWLVKRHLINLRSPRRPFILAFSFLFRPRAS